MSKWREQLRKLPIKIRSKEEPTNDQSDQSLAHAANQIHKLMQQAETRLHELLEKISDVTNDDFSLANGLSYDARSADRFVVLARLEFEDLIEELGIETNYQQSKNTEIVDQILRKIKQQSEINEPEIDIA